MKESFNFKKEEKLKKVEKEKEENGEEKLERIRMKIREMRSEALAKFAKEFERGGKIKENISRHLIKLEEKDIDEIPEEQLLLFSEISNLTSLSEEEYDYYAEKMKEIVSRDAPELEDILKDKEESFGRISAGIRDLIAHVLVKKALEFKIFEEKEKAV